MPSGMCGVHIAEFDFIDTYRFLPHIPPRQVHPQIELHLVIPRQHVFAQLVERLVVIRLLEVRQLMHHDHFQKPGGRVLEQRGDANFFLGLELAALHPGNRSVQAERAVGQVQTVVE